MDDELTNKLNESGVELLEWMKSAAEKGGDFVAEQAPLLASEIVAWHFWSSVAGCVLGVVVAAMLGTAGFLLVRTVRKFGEGYEDIDAKAACFVVGWVFSISAPLVLLLVVGFNAYEAVKASVAPRIVLIEYAGKALGKQP